jgi:hypothetical protein
MVFYKLNPSFEFNKEERVKMAFKGNVICFFIQKKREIESFFKKNLHFQQQQTFFDNS